MRALICLLLFACGSLAQQVSDVAAADAAVAPAPSAVSASSGRSSGYRKSSGPSSRSYKRGPSRPRAPAPKKPRKGHYYVWDPKSSPKPPSSYNGNNGGGILGCEVATSYWAGRYWSKSKTYKKARSSDKCRSSSRRKGFKSCMLQPACETCKEPNFELSDNGYCDCAKGYGMADPEYLPYDPNTDKNDKDESGKPFTCKSAPMTFPGYAKNGKYKPLGSTKPPMCSVNAFRRFYRTKGRGFKAQGYGKGCKHYKEGYYPAGPYCQECPAGYTSDGGPPMSTFCYPENGESPSPPSPVSPPAKSPSPPPPSGVSPSPPSGESPSTPPPGVSPSPPPPSTPCPGGGNDCLASGLNACVEGTCKRCSADPDSIDCVLDNGLAGNCNAETGLCSFPCFSPGDCFGVPGAPVCAGFDTNDPNVEGTCVPCDATTNTCPFSLNCLQEGAVCSNDKLCNPSDGSGCTDPEFCVVTGTDPTSTTGVCLACDTNLGILCPNVDDTCENGVCVATPTAPAAAADRISAAMAPGSTVLNGN